MADRGKLIFVTGAARSGKSMFAEHLAAGEGGSVTYIATCVPGDPEMLERVKHHQSRRPRSWRTIEESLDPARIIREQDKPEQIFLLDCLTLLVSNLMMQAGDENAQDKVLQYIGDLAEVGYKSQAQVIIVSNEVGAGIVPANPLSRNYRDILGRVNQIMAAYADEAYVTIAGIAVELKALGKNLTNKDIDQYHIK